MSAKMRCASCGHDLPAAFPGGVAKCTCGAEITLPPPPLPPRPSEQGPYRAMQRGEVVHTDVPCPYCGNACPPMVRICPHCDVRLENVRCGRCFSLQAPGAFACGRCGDPLELEPLLDLTDAPCPRCTSPLEAASGGEHRLHECPRCGGIFARKDALAEILQRAEVSGGLAEAPRPARTDLDVRYLACPLCHVQMHRQNFGKLSGVIVDVCTEHGTWLDAGELTRIVAFVGAGGLARTREREALLKKEERARAAVARAELDEQERRDRLRRRF